MEEMILRSGLLSSKIHGLQTTKRAPNQRKLPIVGGAVVPDLVGRVGRFRGALRAASNAVAVVDNQVLGLLHVLLYALDPMFMYNAPNLLYLLLEKTRKNLSCSLYIQSLVV